MLSDGRLIATILKVPPETFKPFAIHVSQSENKITFTEFKTKLRSCNDVENMHITASVEYYDGKSTVWHKARARWSKGQ